MLRVFLIVFFVVCTVISNLPVSSAPLPSALFFPGPSSDDSFYDGPQGRHLYYKKRHHGFPGGHGCRGHGCGGWQPDYGGYYPHNQPSGSFAAASAGSVGPSHYGGPASQANAQSATFGFGPFSASFSNAQASSGGYSGF